MMGDENLGRRRRCNRERRKIDKQARKRKTVIVDETEEGGITRSKQMNNDEEVIERI